MRGRGAVVMVGGIVGVGEREEMVVRVEEEVELGVGAIVGGLFWRVRERWL